jgi:hypothetical protein
MISRQPAQQEPQSGIVPDSGLFVTSYIVVTK